MRTDIEKYLHEQGWRFCYQAADGTHRVWAQMVTDDKADVTYVRYDDEAHLVELAMEAMG